MGNKLNTHRKSGTDEQRSRKKRKKSQMKSAADDDKFVSCPDLGGAVPYKDQEDLNVNIKMHRSYKDLDITRDSEKEARPDIKIYRKSAGAELYQASTLPRSFGRSKSNVETRIPNGGAGTHVDIRRQRDTVDGRASRQGSSRRSSNLTVDRCSSRRVTIFMSDFPSTEDIQRRLRLFESHYCLRLVDYYSQLSDTLQVSALSIALRRTPTGSRTVSLLDYLSGRECQPPDDLFQDAARGDVVLTVPPSLIHGITHVRGQCGAGDMGLWTSLASDVVMCVATEASHEVARMYEYQVAVMDDNSVRLLADYGAMCVVEYIKAHSAFLDRNTAVLGVVYGRIPHLIHTPCVLSVIIGNKEELKWDINDVFKSPGLRKDVLLMRSSLKQDEDTLEDEEDFVEEQEELKKFRFYSTSTCDPLLYGYRGQLLEWDFMNGVYKLHPEDEDKFTRQYAHHPDDFHRTYPPYRRLLGIQLMREFCEHQSPGGYTSRKTLNELLTDSPGDVAGRLEVVPVYRPLEPTTERDGPRFDNVNLDGVDLTRVQLGRSDMTSGSLQNARLLLVEGHNAQWPARGIQGTDVSYSCIAPPPGGVPPGTTAKHVLITPTSPPVLNEQRMGGETRYLSDSQGNLINLQQVLEKHQKAAALESARRAAQVSSPEGPLVSSFASTTASDPSDAEKKVRRKKKKKRRQTDSGRASAAPSMDNANGSQRRQGSVNRSASSVESPEGVQVARVSQTRRANSAYNLEHSPPPRGPSRASAPGDSHEEPIRREEAHLHNQSFPETAVRSGPQLDVPQYSSSPAHQKAFSTTNVSVERRGSQRQQLSASQSHHGKLAAAPGGQGMTKSVSHHGHLSTRPRPGGGGHPVEAYGMGWLTTRRQLSQAEVEFIRRSQIFTMMQATTCYRRPHAKQTLDVARELVHSLADVQ